MPFESLLAQLEQNITDSYSMERLAKAGHLSRSQLYRDFYSLAGHTMGEYIRRRRLSNALALIKTSQLTLMDIAHQCGFSSQSALNRAVRQGVGMTPSAYKTSEAYYFFPPFIGHALFPVSVKPEGISQTLCLKYYNAKYKGIEDRATTAFLALIPGFRGRLFGRGGKPRGAKSCYELYITDYEALLPALKNSGFEIGEYGTAFNALFATTTVPNEETKINAAWDYLYLSWLAGSMFERSEHPYFEEYIMPSTERNMKKNQPVKLRLFLPIQKRADVANITLETDPVLHFVVATAKTEKAASQAVVDYLKMQHPHVIQNANEFYLQQNSDGYACGLRVAAPLEAHILTPESGHYLVLRSPSMGDYDALCNRLLTFAAGNSMTARRENCFAVYDTHGGYKNLGMKLYCPVKLSQNNENLELCEKTKPNLM